MLFDTHVHINDEAYNEDLEQVLENAKAHDVQFMAVVGFNEVTIKRALELADKYEFVYLVLGWHPCDANDFTAEHLAWLRTLCAHPKMVALGEMGLDYHWDIAPKDVQKDVFRQQIRLAHEMKLPIVIHNREATADTLQILQEEQAQTVGGIMHCFGETQAVMQQVLALDFHIGIGGTVTFKNTLLPKEAAKTVPLNRLLIETDCPYLAPTPYRGKRNEPAYVQLVAKEIAKLREMEYTEIAKKTTENALSLFKINEK
ncbi:TatD family hydrolase [Brochothrix campestris]|uniref:Uncharacterized protein n=1 Tax=Brochothrix campestris FSL F6-1037 TaxID=1265861 RepID=W7CJP0_9LIST|nr:TatD family hydrolase [Brochothrix campestris]EUJ36051.1 hypothetical protein BCAMP_11145 [Brochothrix campestris FSL F6-1037]